MRLPPLLAVEHQPRLPQDGEMLRHRGLRHAGLGGQHPDRLLALLAQSLEQRAARRIGQSLEEHVPRFNHNPITLRLWFFHNHIAIYRRSEEHTSELQSLLRISYSVF